MFETLASGKNGRLTGVLDLRGSRLGCVTSEEARGSSSLLAVFKPTVTSYTTSGTVRDGVGEDRLALLLGSSANLVS